MMLGQRPGKYWHICWRFLSPLVIAVTIILGIAMYKPPDLDGVKYPEWANILAWLIAMFPIGAIPCWFLYKFCAVGGYKLMKEHMQPLPSFGPMKEQQYADVEPEVRTRFHPSFARLMGSQMSNATTVTEFSSQSSTLNLVRSKAGESRL